MFGCTHRRWTPGKWGQLAVVGGAAALLLLTSSSSLAAGCKKVKGSFVLAPVNGPACGSAVGICAKGTYKGGIAGSGFFTGSSLVQTVDTPTTAVVLLTGDTQVQTAGGGLLTKDAIVLRTIGAGEFAEVDTVIGGTGEWSGATGTLTAFGTFTLAAGGQGTYQGEICTP